MAAEGIRGRRRDPAGIEKLLPAKGGSRKAQAIADLAAYKEARHIYQRLVDTGRKLDSDLATLLAMKAVVHEAAGDIPGAIALYDQSIAIQERLVNIEGHWDLGGSISECLPEQGVPAEEPGKQPNGVGSFRQGHCHLAAFGNNEGHRELATLAKAYVGKANVLFQLGEPRAAEALFTKGIVILKRLVITESHSELADYLAHAYGSKASLLLSLWDKQAGANLY